MAQIYQKPSNDQLYLRSLLNSDKHKNITTISYKRRTDKVCRLYLLNDTTGRYINQDSWVIRNRPYFATDPNSI